MLACQGHVKDMQRIYSEHGRNVLGKHEMQKYLGMWIGHVEDMQGTCYGYSRDMLVMRIRHHREKILTHTIKLPSSFVKKKTCFLHTISSNLSCNSNKTKTEMRALNLS